MTTREQMIEALQGMETILCELDDESKVQTLTEKQVIRGISRALWVVLTWAVKKIDDERRNK